MNENLLFILICILLFLLLIAIIIIIHSIRKRSSIENEPTLIFIKKIEDV